MHLLVAISAHGFGHVAQAAPVVAELRRRCPELRLTLYGATPRAVLERRFAGAFEHWCEPADVGMQNASALDVDVEASARAYRAFHASWEQDLCREGERLAAIAPDLVLVDVPYRVLACAGRLGIPAAALCSLNWAAIYTHYCGERAEAPAIRAQMLAAYDQALFLRPVPSMPMPELARTREIGPIASRGRDRRAEIAARLGLAGGETLVLVATGGIALRLPIEDWPRLPGVRWLVQEDWAVRHPDAVVLERLGMPFVDLLRSCDVLLTKPGYGSFAEAACSATPVLYTPRPDWPESQYLVDWLHTQTPAREVSRECLLRGDLGDALAELLARPAREPVAPSGIADAADRLLELVR